MHNITMLESARDIDLKRHGVIEAHAGTGKTYTIVEMVLRILLEPVADADKKETYPHIRDLLLMTYTEKAAGELKKRIREGIEERIVSLKKDRSGDAAGKTRHLEDCLNNFHESLIGTIHGVCLRLLRTWPFETGVLFGTETVDDADGIVAVLRESIRTDWQKDETLIPWAFEQLMAQGAALEESSFGLVRDIAVKLLDGGNTVLDRRGFGGHTLGSYRRHLDALQKQVDDPASLEAFCGRVTSLIDALLKAKASGQMAPDRVAMLNTRVAQLQSMCAAGAFDTPILKAPLCFGRSKIFTQPDYKKIPGLDQVDALCGSIVDHPYPALLNHHAEIKGYLLFTLISDAAEMLRDRWIAVKQEKGLISFQDMLRLMHRAVMGNPVFCALLGERLRYGIIDEFQDTSTLQWQIVKRVFLETSAENGPRLFIVGDPKQSIYGFQGADVQSYLEAKKTIEKADGRVYGLIENYRSLPETIDGYNTILTREETGPDWFAFDDTIAYPSGGEGGAIARVPEKRGGKPANPLPEKAVQIMVLEGNASARRSTMARWASLVIRALAGKTISVPDGPGWKNDLTLDYSDFAVIVESNGMAGPFLEQFQEDGIPAAKYKMAGVFQSPMARDLQALLRAILYSSGDPAPRLAALLTRFFNRAPSGIDPEKDLEPCGPGGGGNRCACMYHALEEWTFLASRQLWSRLFRSIDDRTGIREFLIQMADGKRHLSDLRQVVDYAIEKLYRGNYRLEQLVEHLGSLLREETSVGQDANLHVRATDKSCVKVLTMHMAKGLEFPVVFVVTGKSGRKGKGMGTLGWVAKDGRRHLMPMASVTGAGSDFERLFENEMNKIQSWEVKKEKAGKGTVHSLEIVTTTKPLPDAQIIQERRRLLYVALTRAQAMLFVPLHCDNPDPLKDPDAWTERALPRSPDTDLTPRLLHLLDKKLVERFDGSRPVWNGGSSTTATDPEAYPVPAASLPEAVRKASGIIEKHLEDLDPASLVSRQTSYTELSREVTVDRATDRSEESFEPESDVPEREKKQKTALPGGKQTGDALHLVLEDLLGMDDINAFLNSGDDLRDLVQKHLDRNGVLKKNDDTDSRTKAIDAAAGFIKAALKTEIALPDGNKTAIADGVQKTDRVPEMEFQLRVEQHWVHGFMDLVFRLRNENAKHPYRYFVLDWKSDRLDAFDKQRVRECMEERHYSLQARIYCHALDNYLKGLLGDAYDPEQNLGGAVYVFLRSFQDTQDDALRDVCHVATYVADPEGDAKFTMDQVDGLVRQKRRR